MLAMAEDSPDSISDMSEHVIASFYQPFHAKYFESSRNFLEAAQSSCNSDAEGSLKQLQSRFYDLVAKFSTIELYRVGPLMEENRYNRIFFWPDNRHIGERQLRDLLAGNAASEITYTRIGTMSVALQGLPVLEQLLHSSDAGERLTSISNTPDCHIVTAVAENLLQIADAINQGWQEDSIFVQSMLTPTDGSEFFRTETEVLQSFVTQVIVGIDIVLNRKIAPLLVDEASIRKAPLWRSNQTLQMIKGNLESIKILTIDSGLAKMAGLEDELAGEFQTTGQILQQLIDQPQLAGRQNKVTSKVQILLQLLTTELKKIEHTLRHQMVPALGVGARFNSGDGD